jgi:glycosyltransferase involved in cell wall biosynthesis
LQSPTISVVIPTYTLTDQLEVMAYNAAKSYREFADELIITEDGGRRSAALLDIADTYVYRDENFGFTANVNLGWKLSTKDFIFIVNSDTYIDSGNPRDLCISGKVTSPYMAGHTRNGEYLNGAFFVVPRNLDRGYLDESMKTYYSDDDYHQRVKDIFQQINTVKFRHIYGASINHKGEAWRDQETERDKIIFNNKWS